MRPLLTLITLLTTLVLQPAGAATDPELLHTQKNIPPDSASTEGRRYALQYCQRCHLFIEPELLPRFLWRDWVIPKMGSFMGMYSQGEYRNFAGQSRGESAEESEIISDAGIYPDSPTVPVEHWDKIVSYYLENSPQQRLPEQTRPDIPANLTALKVRQIPYFGIASTTMVHIDEERQELLVGDNLRRNLTVLDVNGKVRQTLDTDTPPVSATRRNNILWITGIGPLSPTDLPRGELQRFELKNDRYAYLDTPLTQLHRPTFAGFADLTGDGEEEVVMSEFGFQVGRLSLYQKQAEGYSRQVLMNEPGSMQSELRDLNDDGLIDVATVFGQNREGVHIFYNDGKGGFDHSYALQVPSVFGSAHFAMYDFDEDGHLDILTSHGDNGDHTPVLRRYHGVRIYLNDGRNFFTERYFFPQHGAFKALAEDFDQDGDLDIVSIGAFADFAKRPEEGFVFLENLGDFNFRARTVPEADQGRWITMDVGDLDGDDDMDVVLGSYVQFGTVLPPGIQERWDALKRPVLLLDNQLH